MDSTTGGVWVSVYMYSMLDVRADTCTYEVFMLY